VTVSSLIKKKSSIRNAGRPIDTRRYNIGQTAVL